MNDLKISVIIPVYGVEQYIEECLCSVYAQTYANYECIIVDDCSPDNSIAIARRLVDGFNADKREGNKPSFIIVARETNGGLSAARNTGLDHATGDYVFFLDSDDKLMPTSLETLVSLAYKYPGVEMVQGKTLHEDGKTPWQQKNMIYPEYSDDRQWIRTNMLKQAISISAWNKLLRRDYLNKHGLRFMEGIIHEDEMFCWDNQKHITSVAFAAADSYWYRTNSGSSIMHNKDKSRTAESFLKIIDIAEQQYENEVELPFLRHYSSYHLWAIWLPLCSNRESLRNECIRLGKKIACRSNGTSILLKKFSIVTAPRWTTSAPAILAYRIMNKVFKITL